VTNVGRSTRPPRWAPWWVYLVTILGTNYLRQLIMPAGVVPEWAVVVVAVAQSSIVFAIITVGYRAASHRSDR
jgi:hypothetical protein